MTRYVAVYQIAITVAYLVVLGHSYEFGTPENPCGREPADIDLPKRDGWNGYSIVLEGYVYPTTYVPGKTYQGEFSRFHLSPTPHPCINTTSALLHPTI